MRRKTQRDVKPADPRPRLSVCQAQKRRNQGGWPAFDANLSQARRMQFLTTSTCKKNLTQPRHLQIIDFCRVGPTMSWGAPEYVKAWEEYSRARDKAMRDSDVPTEVPSFDFDTHLTPAVDAYGLGGILWSIGEEHTDRLDDRVWRNTPKWFSTLVDRCLSDSPEHRPSIGRILYMLEHKGREIEEPEIVETPIPNTP